jgi:hypothetical protein
MVKMGLRIDMQKRHIGGTNMLQQTAIAIAVILLASAASAADIVARAEAAPELRSSNGKIIPRVVRDDDGHVTRLLLNDIKLSPEDVEDLSRLEHLRSLVLLRTGVTDSDLQKLTSCRKLEHLNLTSTEVTDDAIDAILEFKSLTALCLGNVRISPQAVEKLRERNRESTSGKPLRWGYSQRKQ